MNNPKAVLGIACAASAIAGVAVGYFGAKFYFESKIEKEIEKGTADTRKVLSDVIKSYEDMKRALKQPKEFSYADEESSVISYAPAPEEIKTLQDMADRAEALRNKYIEDGEDVKGVELIDTELDPDDPDSFEEHAAIVTMTDEETGEEIQVYRPAELYDDEEDDEDEDDSDSYIRSREEWRCQIISPEEYRTGEPGQHREELTYYSIDDVLVDSAGIPVDDMNVIGEALSNFGTYGAPSNQVFVRNREEYLDMKITSVDKSFEDAVIPRSNVGKFRRMREYDE